VCLGGSDIRCSQAPAAALQLADAVVRNWTARQKPLICASCSVPKLWRARPLLQAVPFRTQPLELARPPANPLRPPILLSRRAALRSTTCCRPGRRYLAQPRLTSRARMVEARQSPDWTLWPRGVCLRSELCPLKTSTNAASKPAYSPAARHRRRRSYTPASAVVELLARTPGPAEWGRDRSGAGWRQAAACAPGVVNRHRLTAADALRACARLICAQAASEPRQANVAARRRLCRRSLGLLVPVPTPDGRSGGCLHMLPSSPHLVGHHRHRLPPGPEASGPAATRRGHLLDYVAALGFPQINFHARCEQAAGTRRRFAAPQKREAAAARLRWCGSTR